MDNAKDFAKAIEDGKTLGCLNMRVYKDGGYIKVELPAGGFSLRGNVLKTMRDNENIVMLIYEDEFAGIPYSAIKGTFAVSEWKVVE